MVDPCYHQACDDLKTVLTGVMPLDAQGLGGDTEADQRAARRKMAGGSLQSLKELGGAAAYAVYYFGFSKDPFGTNPKPHKPPKHRGGWHGHGHRLGR